MCHTRFFAFVFAFAAMPRIIEPFPDPSPATTWVDVFRYLERRKCTLESPFSERVASDSFPLQIEAARAWVRERTAKRKTFFLHNTSYGFKAMAERYVDHYVCNDAMKIALCWEGYRLKPFCPPNYRTDLTLLEKSCIASEALTRDEFLAGKPMRKPSVRW